MVWKTDVTMIRECFFFFFFLFLGVTRGISSVVEERVGKVFEDESRFEARVSMGATN